LKEGNQDSMLCIQHISDKPSSPYIQNWNLENMTIHMALFQLALSVLTMFEFLNEINLCPATRPDCSKTG